MITPQQQQQIDNYLKTSNYTPPTQSSIPAGQDWYSQVKAQTKTTPEEPGYLSRVGSEISSRASDAYRSLTKPGNDVVGAGLNIAGQTLMGALSPVTQGIQSLAETPLGKGTADLTEKLGGKAADIINKTDAGKHAGKQLATGVQGTADIVNQYTNWAKQHPDAADALSGIFNIGQAIATAVPIGTEISKGIGALPEMASGIKTTIKSGIDGGPDGGGGGGVGKLITPSETAKTASIDKLESDYSRWKSGTKPGVKELSRIDDRTEAFNRSGVKASDPQRILAESKVIPDVEGTKFRTADQAKEFRNGIKPLSDANKQALGEVAQQTPPINLDEWQQRAINNANKIKMPAGDKVSLISDIKDEFANLRSVHGDNIKITDLNGEKSTYQGDVKFDANKPFKRDAYYHIGKAAQTIIEDKATQAGFPEVAQLNRDIGDRLQAADYLESLDGNTIKGGRLSKYVLGSVGSSIGQSPLGKVFGYVGGNALADYLMKLDISNPIQRYILKSIETTDPKAYNAALNFIKQEAQARSTRLLLPEGKPGYSGETYPIDAIPLGAPKAPVDLGRQAPGGMSGYAESPMNLKPENLTPNEQGVQVRKILDLRDKSNRPINLRQPRQPVKVPVEDVGLKGEGAIPKQLEPLATDFSKANALSHFAKKK